LTAIDPDAIRDERDMKEREVIRIPVVMRGSDKI